MTAQSPELDATLSAEMAALLEQLARELGPVPDPTLLPPAEGRAMTEEGNRRWNTDLPPMAAVSEITIPADPALSSAPCRIKVLVPPNAGSGAILFAHGGGFALCSPESHERCARVLACDSGLPVLLPDYRLAPEHPFPAGLMDVIASLRAVQERPEDFGLTPGPLLVAGDSAGANLVLAAMLHEQEQGRPLPAGGLFFYGVFAADHDTPSHRFFAQGPGLTTAKMQRYWDWYLPDHAARDNVLASPLRADDAALAGLPPLFLLAAGIDPLLSDTLSLSARLETLGRKDPLTVVPGVIHGFLQMTHSLAAARQSLAAAGEAARQMRRATD
ncbi:alpha/beta hydrolase [Telmatospirillum sp. J64-1]|uniref:alpha/beta hydrolase n=1 Tax=Telmatospirillum sp. J64-1 TaxID=2502183 RepID=UPI00115E806B|nr:alpha/beta hydrolase [Telmatospirillum sp. J64-1]